MYSGQFMEMYSQVLRLVTLPRNGPRSRNCSFANLRVLRSAGVRLSRRAYALYDTTGSR
jgi:hypothetical protein